MNYSELNYIRQLKLELGEEDEHKLKDNSLGVKGQP